MSLTRLQVGEPEPTVGRSRSAPASTRTSTDLSQPDSVRARLPCHDEMSELESNPQADRMPRQSR
eukprot:2615782-Rhodomonas_salina.2